MDWKLKINSIIVTGVMFFLLNSCLQTTEFPPEPEIEYDSFTLIDSTDALGNPVTICKVIISFTDGDGDIGLRESDTTGRFSPDSLFYNNLLVDYYEEQNGQMVLIELEPSYSGRIPYITPPGQNKQLRGSIEYDMDISFRNSDRIQFDIRLVDRSFNVSNTVSTPIINVD